MPKLIDLTGKKINSWSVFQKSDERQGYWICVCKCGKTCEVHGKNLREGKSKNCISCRPSRATHGMTGTGIYHIWIRMKQRCGNINCDDYVYYGGRGIRVCERWKNSFENFFFDMGNKPKDRTLDRIDNDGNYCKENCRWATHSEQQLNKRKT